MDRPQPAVWSLRLALAALFVAALGVDTNPQSTTADSAGAAAGEGFDLVIVGGRIMDGTGNPWFAGDVGVRDGRIVAVGQLDSTQAVRTIDARGKFVAPGFIDLHSHAASGLTAEASERRAAPNLVTQGITTVVLNPDGYSSEPVPEQVKRLARKPFGPNAIVMVGHNSIRRAVLGEDARRKSTGEEIERMRALIAEGMSAGAFGLTAGLEYEPGLWSETSELIALVEEIVPDRGVFIVHERAGGADPMWYLPSQHKIGQPTMVQNILELIDVGQKTGATVVATHIKARGVDFWGSSGVMVNLISRARARGVNIYADQYPYNTTGSDGRIVLLPDWLWGSRKKRKDRTGRDYAAPLEVALVDDKATAKLQIDVAHEIKRRGGAENIVVMEHPDESLVGKTVLELADGTGKNEFDTVCALQLDGDRYRRGGARLRSFSLSELDVEEFARQTWTATSTDAGIALPGDGPVHARFYGSYPRKIRRYAIKRGLMTVENAIRSATSLPAQILGLRDRGQVREGFHADLVVFDLEEIRDKADFTNPHQYSEGVEFVCVGGVPIVKDGEVTGDLPGKVIKRSEGRLPPRVP